MLWAYIYKSTTTADDKGKCIFFGAGEGFKIVARQKFDLQKRSLLDRIWYNNSYKMHIHKKSNNRNKQKLRKKWKYPQWGQAPFTTWATR